MPGVPGAHLTVTLDRARELCTRFLYIEHEQSVPLLMGWPNVKLRPFVVRSSRWCESPIGSSKTLEGALRIARREA